MKYVIIVLLTFCCQALRAQLYSDLDKARFAFCLMKGKIGNFVEQSDSVYLFDVRDCENREGTFERHLLDMLRFVDHYYAYPTFRGTTPYCLTNDKNDQVREMRVGRDRGAPLSFSDAQKAFLDMLPYHGVYSLLTDEFSHVIELQRIAGFSPVTVEKDYVDLIAMIYHNEFIRSALPRLTIKVDIGTEPKVERKIFEYEQTTNWAEIERRLYNKILTGKPTTTSL